MSVSLMRLAAIAAVIVWLLAPVSAEGAKPAASSGGMLCTVSAPISAAELNAGGTWSFEVFNARPNTDYKVKVNWPGDPSNGGHTNTDVVTDAAGYGVTVLPGHWSPDGFLPGVFDAQGVYTAMPGPFSVQVGPGTYDGDRAGKANCDGDVLP